MASSYTIEADVREKAGTFCKLTGSFSWRWALGFLAAGVVGALVAELRVSDNDRRSTVESHDGLRLVYEVQGQGPPLIALAGGPGISHHGFHPYLGGLRRHATVVYFDPRGRGDSDAASSYSVADDVRDLESLRKALRLSDVDLLGVSYGAHLAVAYALEFPHRTRKLVLVSPIVGRSAWQAHLEILSSAPGMASVLSRIRARGREALLSDGATADAIVRTLIPLYWCNVSDARRASSPFRHRHRIARQNFDVYEAIVGRPFGRLNGDLAASETETRLGQIEAPALIIRGGCDAVVPDGHAAWLREQMPRCEIRVLVGAGHSPFVDARERFLAEVIRFLTSPADRDSR